MIQGKLTGIVFALTVFILLQNSFYVSQADEPLSGQLWYYVVDDYWTNANYTPVLNWTVDVGVRHQVFAVCNASFDGRNATCIQTLSKWSFYPARGVMSSSSYTNVSSGGWQFPSNIPDSPAPQNPRYISFFAPGVYRIEAVGYCPGWGGDWKPIVGYITVRGITNLTKLAPITMQNELDSPAFYGKDDYSMASVQWKSPTSGVGIVASNKYTNPFNYSIQLGYLGMIRDFIHKYTQYPFSDEYEYTTNVAEPILDLFALQGSSVPITPVITLQPGETKYTLPFNTMPFANITNCTTTWRPDLPILGYTQYVYGALYVMMKPVLPNSFWVPMQLSNYEATLIAKINSNTNTFEVADKTFYSYDIPPTSGQFLMPSWNTNTGNQTFVYIQFRNTTAPYCWYKAGPEYD